MGLHLRPTTLTYIIIQNIVSVKGSASVLVCCSVQHKLLSLWQLLLGLIGIGIVFHSFIGAVSDLRGVFAALVVTYKS